MALTKFVKYINGNECRFQLDLDDVKDLEDAVTFVLKRDLPETFNNLPECIGKYSIDEIINAGSYFEQTKIKRPDEFDFMVVFQELSNPRSLMISKGCRKGYVNVKTAGQIDWGTTYSYQTPEQTFEIAMLGFNACLRKVLELTKDDVIYEGRRGCLIFQKIVARGKPYKTFSHVQTAYFKWHKIRAHEQTVGCNKTGDFAISGKTLQLEEEGMDIDVDLMTCCHVDLHILEDFLDIRPALLPLLASHGCHIVLKSCDSDACIENGTECRLVSYTKLEQQQMRDLHVSWKTVYRVIKWIFQYSEHLGIDTYKLKTAVLHLSQKRTTTELDHGIVELIQYLNVCAKNRSMAGFFNPAINVWNISICFEKYAKWELLALDQILQTMKATPENEYNAKEFSEVLNLWMIEFNTLPNVLPLHYLEKSISPSKWQLFCDQGNTFEDIVKKVSIPLSKYQRYRWLAFRLKMHLLSDVIYFLFQRMSVKSVRNGLCWYCE